MRRARRKRWEDRIDRGALYEVRLEKRSRRKGRKRHTRIRAGDHWVWVRLDERRMKPSRRRMPAVAAAAAAAGGRGAGTGEMAGRWGGGDEEMVVVVVVLLLPPFKASGRQRNWAGRATVAGPGTFKTGR